MQQRVVEKRSSGHIAPRSAAWMRSSAASPVAHSPRSPRSRKRGDAFTVATAAVSGSLGVPAGPSMLKPLAASLAVYASVGATVWNFWGYRSGRPAEQARIELHEPSEGAPPAPPDVSGEPLTLKGELVLASLAWAVSGAGAAVGDQRRRGVVQGLAPSSLKAREAELHWREVFELVLATGERVSAAACNLTARSPMPDAAGYGDVKMLSGEALTLACPLGFQVRWSAALLRFANGAEVLRSRIVLDSNRQGAPAVERLRLFSLQPPGGAAVACTNATATRASSDVCLRAGGSVDGSPLIDDSLGVWLSLEHPRGSHTLANGTVALHLASPAMRTPYLASLGVVLARGSGGGSTADAFHWLRRHFNAYLDMIRASAHRPNLLYTTWYDLRRKPCVDSSELGRPFCKAGRVMDERTTMDRLQLLHSELASRGVPLDGMLLEDGWDDTEEPWRAERSNFPNGIAPLGAAAAARNVSLGVWISPWGGFGESGKRRIRAGVARSFELHAGSQYTFRLGGPNYRARFRNATLDLVGASNVSMFKVDGFGAGMGATSAGAYSEDIDRLLDLTEELRGGAARDLWVTLSTGSWPSPFWLMSASAVWRGGPDLGRLGAGSARQQWITFRDAMVRQWVVQRAPLFPLSSLALGGIVWSSVEEPGAYLSSYDADDFAAEVRSFFLTGVTFQELYLQPALLTPRHWDVLAEAANLSRAHSVVLRDSHWAGGDPQAGEVYGYAAFACPPCRGLLSWRNPQAAPQNLTFTLRAALAVPRSWPGGATGGRWRLEPLWAAGEASSSTAAPGNSSGPAPVVGPAPVLGPAPVPRSPSSGPSPAPQPGPAPPRRLGGSLYLDDAMTLELGAFELWAMLATPLPV